MVPEGWRSTKLDCCVEFRSGGTPSKQKPEFWGGKIPWVSAKDLKSHLIAGAQDHLTDLGAASAKMAQKNQILILVRGMTLLKDVPVGLVAQPVAFNQDIKALVSKDGVDPVYLSYLLVGKKLHLMGLVNTANHGTGRLDTDLLKGFRVSLPPLPEQKKIAEILSTWDRAIEVTEKLLENATRQKRALMQQLLTGKRRFPEFERSEWREAYLGEFFDERNDRGEIDLPLLSITGSRGIIMQEEVARRDTSRGDKSSYKKIESGDIGYNTMRMWQGVSALSRLKGLVSPAYTILIPRPNINPRFAAHLFKLPRQVFLFSRYSQGLTSDTWNLKFKQFSKVPTFVPGFEEQEKIARILDHCDLELDRIAQQISLLNNEKKALMQQLLTGKKRVNV